VGRFELEIVLLTCGYVVGGQASHQFIFFNLVCRCLGHKDEMILIRRALYTQTSSRDRTNREAEYGPHPFVPLAVQPAGHSCTDCRAVGCAISRPL
jgi:hypothetical protein